MYDAIVLSLPDENQDRNLPQHHSILFHSYPQTPPRNPNPDVECYVRAIERSKTQPAKNVYSTSVILVHGARSHLCKTRLFDWTKSKSSTRLYLQLDTYTSRVELPT
eukprot:scaffold6774_cov91-Cylindrotheca_fusiformis.AAC.5